MAEGAKDSLSDLQAQIAKNNDAKARLRDCRAQLACGVTAGLKVCDREIKTAGGYRIELTDPTTWKIYDPCGKEITKVWGDPHVNEADGTRWDFTKDSEFHLPDGTRIAVDTSADQGHSVTQGLHIVNGDDIVHVDGGRVTGVGHDGQAWLRGPEWAKEHDGDVFKLGGDGDDWFKFTKSGQSLGEVTRGFYANEGYQQTTNGAAYSIAFPHAKPAVATRECLDVLRQLKVPVPQGIDANQPLSEEQKQRLTKALDDAIATTGDLNEELSFKLQLAMGQLSRALEAASSVSKKFTELASSILRNV